VVKELCGGWCRLALKRDIAGSVSGVNCEGGGWKRADS
jgi:hypothetical protein